MIKDTINAFIQDYKQLMDVQDKTLRHSKRLVEAISRHPVEIQSTLELINSGDCGLAALAIGIRLKRAGYDVSFFENSQHAYFGVDGYYYDTLVPEGTDDHKKMYGYTVDKPVKEQTVKQMHMSFMPYDSLGEGIANYFLVKHTQMRYPYKSLDASVQARVIDGRIKEYPVV